ncbi:MAG: sigma-70 family RNA polymerase sigma factor [Cytophagales bacterium]|nr:sigma-70 family RNA polymerase sigma factor [Cytophagales bacterium]
MRPVNEDSLLVRQYIQGDERAFAQLVHKYRTRVFATIYVVLRNPTLAEDVTQECFFKVIKTFKTGKYKDEGKFLPWLLRVARNKAVDYYRKAKKAPEIDIDMEPDLFNSLGFAEKSIEEKQVDEDTKRKLQHWLNCLPTPQKDVIVMRHYMGMSFQEIADETGVSINTALGRMRYALQNLRKQARLEGRKQFQYEKIYSQ